MPEMPLPGANVLSVLMQVPTDVMNMATRQVTEAMGAASMRAQTLAMELSKPPVLPTNLPFLPANLPFPMMPGMFPGATQNGELEQEIQALRAQQAAARVGIQSGATPRRNGRGLIV